MIGVLRAAWLIARKDLRRRGAQPRAGLHDAVLRGGVRARLLVRVRARTGQRRSTNAAAGILWVAVAFSGTLALGRAFERERQAETLRALLLAPVERGGGLPRQAVGAARCSWRASSSSLVPARRAAVSTRPSVARRWLLVGAACRRHAGLCRGRDAVCRHARARAVARRAAAGGALSDHRAGAHRAACRARPRSSPRNPNLALRADVAGDAGIL